MNAHAESLGTSTPRQPRYAQCERFCIRLLVPKADVRARDGSELVKI